MRVFQFDLRKYGPRLSVDVLRFEASWALELETAYRLLYTEVLLVRAGRAVVEIDDASFAVQAGSVCLSPPGAVRRVRAARGLRGLVLLLGDELPGELLADPVAVQRLPAFADGRPRAALVDRVTMRRLASMLLALEGELLSGRPDTPALAHAMAWPLVLEVNRVLRDAGTPAAWNAGAADLVRRFQALVVEQFAASHRVDRYCRQLNVSRKHLSAVCARELRLSPRQVILRHVMLEAKRLLAYTTMTNEQVAQAVGFADGAHFARVFRRHDGATPGEFRAHR